MNRKLVIADDHEILRDGLASLITSRSPKITLVASVDDAQSAIVACRIHQPDLLLLDIEMPGRDSMAAAREIRQLSPGTKIVIFSSYCSNHFIAAAHSVDIRGYLLKNEPVEMIVEGLQKVLFGERIYSKAVRSRMRRLQSSADVKAPSAMLKHLTPREIEILRYIGKGLDNIKMAEIMSLSRRTVERHVYRLMDAVGIRDRRTLADLAQAHGYVPPQHQDLHFYSP